MLRASATVAVATAALLALPGNSHHPEVASARLPALIPDKDPSMTAKQVAVQWHARSPEPEHPFGQTPSGYVLPVQRFRISSYFRNTDPVHTGGVHSGVDFAEREGAKIVSIAAGKVVESGWMGAAGNAAIVRTDTGHRILYGHMSANFVTRGEEVAAGDPIGLIGSTGNSTGPHLHLQVNTPRGKLTDPVTFMGLDHREVARYGRG